MTWHFGVLALAWAITAGPGDRGTPRSSAAVPPAATVCERAAQIVQAGAPADSIISSYSTLNECAIELVVPALVSAWGRSVSADERSWRQQLTTEISDRRLLTAVLNAAKQPRPDEERVSALSMLSHLMSPGHFLTMPFWFHATEGQLADAIDSKVEQGSQPITAADRLAALQGLDTMASTDGNPTARAAAKRLAALLRAG
jgi:hypothetical protein